MANRKAPDLLHSAAIHLLRRVSRADDESGIGRAQLSALSVLYFAGAKTLSELAAAERVTPPTMSRIVDALQRDDLVLRVPHLRDRRAVTIVLTAKGTRAFARARERRLELLDRLFAKTTRAELATLERAAEIVERALRDA